MLAYSTYVAAQTGNTTLNYDEQTAEEGFQSWRCQAEGMADLVIVAKDGLCQSIYAETAVDVDPASVDEAVSSIWETAACIVPSVRYWELGLDGSALDAERDEIIRSLFPLFGSDLTQLLLIEVAAGMLPHQLQMDIAGHTVELTVDVTDDSWSQLLFRVTVMP